MRPLSAQEFAEVLDLEAKGELDDTARRALLAELVRLRQFRAVIARCRRLPLPIEHALERIPSGDCAGVWWDAARDGARTYEEAQPGAADLLNLMRAHS